MPIADNTLEKLRTNNLDLTDLSFSGNPVGDDGAKTLAKALEHNHVLQSLELGNGNITAVGAKCLADALHRNIPLKTLYLRGNKVGDEGAKSLSEALIKNDQLEHLYLGGNEIGIEGVKAFANAFTKNSTLQTIYLRNNHVTDEGAQILADALVKNFGLKVLNLANAEITEVGCQSLIKLLDTNTTLQSIVFEHNGVESEEIAKAFDERLKYNASVLVAASNDVAKKILLHCEGYLELEKNKNEKDAASLEELSKKCSLSRAEQYHWSGSNLQGNAILCVSFLSRMISGRYWDKTVAAEISRIVHQIYEPLLIRAKEDLANSKVAKPNATILQAAQQFLA